MAGCRPEYFPVVVAALEAMFDSAFNLHTVLTSTGGAALCVVVSGPIAAEIGMNARHNALGQGNRANATIGRALRLIATNALGSRPGESDASSFGHPGKFTLCFAEDPPPAPWQPLSVQLGYAPGDTTVTVVPSEGPHQLAQQLTSSAEDVLRSFARSITHPTWFSTGKGGHGVLVLGPEHAGFCVSQGWTQERVREFVYRESRIAPAELLAAGVGIEDNAQHDMIPGEDGKLATLELARRGAARHRRRRGRRLVGLDPGLGADDPRLPRVAARPPGRRAAAGLRPGRLHRSLGSLMAEITVLRPDTDAPAVAAVTLAAARRASGPAGDRPGRRTASRSPSELLTILAEELGKRLGREVDLELLTKPGAGYPILDDEATQLAARSHLVIAGLGD